MQKSIFSSKLAIILVQNGSSSLISNVVNNYFRKFLQGLDKSSRFEYLLISQEILGVSAKLSVSMEKNVKLIKVLNDLLEINNDRIGGYQLASNKSEEVELKNVFSDLTASSFQFCHDLVSEVQKLEGSPIDSRSQSGKAFTAWTQVRAAILSKDRNAILTSCELGEDAALDAYENALNQDVFIDSALIEKVQQQRMEILKAHSRIKKMNK